MMRVLVVVASQIKMEPMLSSDQGPMIKPNQILIPVMGVNTHEWANTSNLPGPCIALLFRDHRPSLVIKG